MTKLPKLPNPSSVLEAKYTAEQMRDYARKAEAAEREACARLVEPSEDHRRNPNDYIGGEEVIELLDNQAAAIRARGQQ